MRDSNDINPVLILGAGVNGCAVARELVLNNVPVTIVDTADIATGATAKSSRLIHGGVRYLEYADFHLVAESLAERERQLKLAPQFVKPLRLHIPVRRRLGGLIQSGFRFLGLTRFSLGRTLSSKLSPWSERGLYTVRFGLWMYDWIARSSLLPGHSVHRLDDGKAPKVDPRTYKWVCSYSDAQMVYPERFVIALLKDAQQHAAEHNIDFQVLPYHEVELDGRHAKIRRLNRQGVPDEGPAKSFQPSVIINATGAWGDLTLDALDIESPRLFGGTKGSHIITQNAALRAAIGDDGIYAESSDGRLVFVLPFGNATLVGTTDLRFDGPPGEAVATEEEIQYLLDMVNSVIDDLHLTRDDVTAHYCGVRPLPYVPSGKTGSIPRGHSCHTTNRDGIPLHTLIGGKLTTWRAFAQEVADRVLGELRRPRVTQTQDRPIPGAYDDATNIDDWIQQTSAQTHQPVEAIRFLFPLMGKSAASLLSAAHSDELNLSDLPVSAATVNQIIRREWVTRLSDLVERRLALVFAGNLSLDTLEALADCLVSAGQLAPEDRTAEIEDCRKSLRHKYGIVLGHSDSM